MPLSSCLQGFWCNFDEKSDIITIPVPLQINLPTSSSTSTFLQDFLFLFDLLQFAYKMISIVILVFILSCVLWTSWNMVWCPSLILESLSLMTYIELTRSLAALNICCRHTCQRLKISSVLVFFSLFWSLFSYVGYTKYSFFFFFFQRVSMSCRSLRCNALLLYWNLVDVVVRWGWRASACVLWTLQVFIPIKFSPFLI